MALLMPQLTEVAPAEALATIEGFADDTSTSMQRTSLFIAGANDNSNGRCAYRVTEDGNREWIPNTQVCYLMGVTTVVQSSEAYGDAEKLLVTVANAANGQEYTYRCGLASWTASSFMRAFSVMTDNQLRDELKISLVGKSRTTFVNLYSKDEAGNWVSERVPADLLKQKMSEDEAKAAVTELQSRLG